MPPGGPTLFCSPFKKQSVVYLPLYAAGIPYLRSLVWLIASGGIALVLLGLFYP